MLRINQYLIALQNAQISGKECLSFPFSKHIWECAQALQSLGILDSVRIFHNTTQKGVPYSSRKYLSNDSLQRSSRTPWHSVECSLRYVKGVPVLRKVQLVTTPSRKVSWKFSQVLRESNHSGSLLLLTQYGILTEREAVHAKIGGFPLCRLFLSPWQS